MYTYLRFRNRKGPTRQRGVRRRAHFWYKDYNIIITRTYIIYTRTIVYMTTGRLYTITRIYVNSRVTYMYEHNISIHTAPDNGYSKNKDYPIRYVIILLLYYVAAVYLTS